MTSDDLASERAEGRDAIRAALRELEIAGYLRRRKRQNDRGRWTTEVTISDTPSTDDGFSGVGRPMTGKPTAGLPKAGRLGAKSSSTKHQTISKAQQLQPEAHLLGEASNAVVVEVLKDLSVPPQLAAAQALSATQILAKEGCPSHLQQDVLDELQGAIERGEVRSSPLRLLRGLARSAVAGAFVLDLGSQVRERRKREAEQAANRVDIKQRTHIDPSAAQAHIAEIRRVLRGRAGA